MQGQIDELRTYLQAFDFPLLFVGDSAPKIYLAGWLDLSPHRRRMLEDHCVVPIDLARHRNAHVWPEHLRHRYATEWVLHTLERGRPYEVTNWPSPVSDWIDAVPDYLQPVVETKLDQPRDEARRGMTLPESQENPGNA